MSSSIVFHVALTHSAHATRSPLCEAGDPNSCPHACAVSTFPPEPYPWPPLASPGLSILNCYFPQCLADLRWESLLAVCRCPDFSSLSVASFYSVTRSTSFRSRSFDKIPWLKQFRQKGFILACSSRRVDLIIVEKTQAKKAW